MAKGAASKQEVIATILETFGDRAFLYNDGKEVRVNCVENGEPVQIKITLTAAKAMVAAGEDNAMPGIPVKQEGFPTPVAKEQPVVEIKPSEEERDAVAALMKELGL